MQGGGGHDLDLVDLDEATLFPANAEDVKWLVVVEGKCIKNQTLFFVTFTVPL